MNLKHFVIIAIIALSLTGCPTDKDDGGNTLTIDGLPPNTYVVYVFSDGTDISTRQAVNVAFQGPWEAFGIIDSGNVFTLYAYTEEDYYDKHWTKSGNFPVHLNSNNLGSMWYATVNFSNGNGTTQFSSFTLCQ